jgi:glucokinase
MLVGALEIGGTHAASAIVDAATRRVVGRVARVPLDPRGGRTELAGAILRVALDAAAGTAVARWGVAVPGPFDYARGICLIRGVAKLEALYGLDLRAQMAQALTVEANAIRFLNDADAFLLGEWWAGAAGGSRRAMGITLGTGLGSAFLVDGRLVEEGPGVPPEGRFDLLDFDGRPVEEAISARAIRRSYSVLAGDGSEALDVVDIAARARSGEPAARSVLIGFGASLGRFVAPWLTDFAPQCVVLGGSIARAWALFGREMLAAPGVQATGREIVVARDITAAPLLGAAFHAVAR